MTDPDLYLEDLEIDRMPGFPPTRAFGIGGLSPGVNVIHGPNASGKTTIAEAVSIAVHGADGGMGEAILRGRLRTRHQVCEVRVEAGERSLSGEGEALTEASLQTRAGADRYRLWLHELLRSEDPNRPFAEHVLQESRGGYDVRQARDDLGFRPSPSPANISQHRDWKARQEELREVGQEVIDPRETERRLERLEHEREELQESRERIAALEQAVEYRRHQDALDAAETKLDELPDALEEMTGDELDGVAELREQREEAEARAREARQDIEAAQAEIAAADLPEETPRDNLVVTLRERAQALQGVEDRIRQLEKQLRAADDGVEEARAALGDVTDPEALEDADTALIQRAERVAEDAESLHSRQGVLEAVDDWLTAEVAVPDREGLDEAVRALRRWLQQPEGPGSATSGRRWISITASVLTALAGAGGIALTLSRPLASVVGVVAGGLLLAGLVLLLVSLREQSAYEGTETRAAYERDFRRSGHSPPENWERGAVEDRLEDLEDALIEAMLAEEREQRHRELAPDREALEEDREDVRRRTEEITGEVGIDVDLGQRSFVWFVRNLADWQRAHTARAEARGELEDEREERERLAELLGDDLRRFGYDAAADAAEVRANVEDLDGRIRSVREQRRKLENAEDTEAEARDRAREKEEKIRALFEEFELEPGDDAGLQRLCDRLPDYEKALQEKSEAKPLRDEALEKLHGEPGYAERMEELSETGIAAELDELDGTRQRLTDLGDEIPSLRERIRSAKEEDRVEAALEARDRAVAALRDKMEEDTDAVVGWALAEHVHERTREEELPAVFHRARELLATFTRGRYELQFRDSDPPAFRALDTWHGEEKDLDELSSGSRVQLLLAVRLAFVERHEQSAKLPLVLDETLANTDDIRARAVIEAVIEAARDGRQVFYLTAQQDEVAKWRSVLENSEEPMPAYRVIDLAEQRALTREKEGPAIEIPLTPFREVPAPDQHSHEDYGGVIGVPPFDPREDPGATHLWYLIDDLDVLHTLLDLGIDRWGQLKTLRSESRELDELLADEAWRRYRARAKVLAAYRRAWSRGRGEAVDRAVLEEAPGVTSTKIDEVAEVAESVNGDPEQLLKDLERGAVSYFRDAQREKLESFLRREGYLPDQPRLSPEEVRHRTAIAVVDEIEADLIDREEVETLLRRAIDGP